MARKKKEAAESVVDISNEPLMLRPEQVVKYITDNGCLPPDFNPYGDYMPEEIKFLGEQPPKNTKYFVGINEADEDVTPIYVSTPTPPAKELIANHDLPDDDQYWRRLEVPPRLKKLEEKAFLSMYEIEKRNRQDTVQGYKVYQKYWELLEEAQDDYKEEIQWIKHIWWYRINGYWMYNDGEAVYCTGEYFDYLQFWFIKDSETWVEFREEDRRISIFSHYLRTTTESFVKINSDTGRAVPNDDGTYEMTNIGSRVFFGDMKPKFRRCGETQWACHGIWQGCSTTPAAYGTIISMDGNNAGKHYFKKMLPAWNKYPMFLKPIWVGSKRPTTIKLIEPPNIFHIEGLGSSIDYTESGGTTKNDGDTLYFCLSDEEGKCFGFDTPIIMSNGDIRKVQEIKDGDKVMGDDGTPRLVSGSIRGYGNLYEVSSKFGSFVCNEDHVISLRTSNRNMFGLKEAGSIINLPLTDVVKLSNSQKRNLKLYRKPIVYEQRNVALDPYFLGLWLGDGSHGHADVTNIDEEVISYLKEYAKLWGGVVHCGDGKTHRIVFNSYLRGNPIRTTLKRMNLLYNKHIPTNYIKNTEEVRLQLLAGIIDTDGSRDPKDQKLVYEITQKRKVLAEQICQLANSLGFWSRIENKVATMKRKDGTIYRCDVYRVKIYGDIYKIPVRVTHKKYIEPTGFRNKNSNASWFEINPIGEGDYYGFAVDGNHLFMLANQVVVHNSKTPISERWNVNKIAMSTGGGTNILRNAYAWHPSTVEDIGEGGLEYFKMWQLSNFYERIPIMGQTHSGLARIFIPAYKKLEGYIDRWGKSVIDTPTERQIKYSPRAKFALTGKGARETLEAVLDSLLAKGTPEALEAYRSRRRKFPMKSADCWLGSSGSVGFNMEILDKRLEEINRMRSFEKPPYKVGYFMRERGDPDGKVVWVDDSDKPIFKMSMDIPEVLTNQREAYEVWDGLSQRVIPSWRPINGQRFTMGCDPYRNLKAQEAKLGAKFGGGMSNSRQSDGGIVVLWEHDPEIDKSNNRKEWESFRVVLTYRYRPATQEDYFEDILMAAQYFGAMIYPEQNVDALVPYIYKRGYYGYCLFDIGIDGKQKQLPGRYNATETNQDMIRAAKDYIEFRGHVECHDDLLRECKSLRGIEDVTHKDIFAAFGMALLGSKSRYREIMSMGGGDEIEIDGLF